MNISWNKFLPFTVSSEFSNLTFPSVFISVFKKKTILTKKHNDLKHLQKSGYEKKLSNHTGKQQMRTVLNKFSRVVLHQITVEEVTAFFIKEKSE